MTAPRLDGDPWPVGPLLQGWAHERVCLLEARVAELERALETAQAEARRYASFYPQSSDGRNTFIMLADRIAALRPTDTEET